VNIEENQFKTRAEIKSYGTFIVVQHLSHHEILFSHSFQLINAVSLFIASCETVALMVFFSFLFL